MIKINLIMGTTGREGNSNEKWSEGEREILKIVASGHGCE